MNEHLDLTVPCIIVPGVHIDSNGYTGRHRKIWMAVFGDIPPGHDIDHECHNLAVQELLCAGGPTCLHRACLNILHLRCTDRGDNIRRGYIPTAESRAKKADKSTEMWLTISRDPVTCEQCGSGPFKGPRSLSIHIGRMHK